MKRLIALVLSVIIMGAILVSVDRAELWANMKATRPIPFIAALMLFIPQNFIIIVRWRFLASRFTSISFANAAGMILAGASMNVLLPSKLGDLTKAVFLYRQGALDMPRASGLVVFEKMLDLGSLCLLAVAGVVGAMLLNSRPNDSVFLGLSALTVVLSVGILGTSAIIYFAPEGWFGDRIPARFRDIILRAHEIIRLLRERQSHMGMLCGISLLLWVLHLWQIYFFFVCLNASVPALPFATLMPLAIFVGLLPLSLFGIGTRDWAIITLFSAYHPPAVLAGVGMYVSLRYLIPALAGLPFLSRYVGWTKDLRAEQSK